MRNGYTFLKMIEGVVKADPDARLIWSIQYKAVYDAEDILAAFTVTSHII